MEKNTSREQIKILATDWINQISDRGEVGIIDTDIVKGFLIDLGASSEISQEAKDSLSKYPNFEKRFGLNEVWGKELIDTYKTWIKGEYIPSCEEKFGREFPTLYDPKTKTYDERGTTETSGSMQFLGEITAFAYDALSFKDYKKRTESRAKKGFLWAEGKYKPSNNHPFPPGLPKAAIAKIPSIYTDLRIKYGIHS